MSQKRKRLKMLLLDTVINFINFKIIIMKTIYFYHAFFYRYFYLVVAMMK